MQEPLDLTADYTAGDYVYKMGGDGSTVVNGKKQIDCSHMVNLLLKRAGYNIPYEDTRVMNNSTYYTTVLPQDVKRGDIALWINASSNQGGSPLFHTGIIEDFNPATNAGHFFGAQTSTGPAKAVFGPRPPSFYWPVATKFLRAKEEFRTGSAPAASPEPPAPAAAAPVPLINFQYPFRKADGKQFTDAEDIYKALERETSGHYLLGGNKFWHGGIHITDKSAPQCVRNEPIRCIADGEVVAYRLNHDYLESTFGDNEKRLKYTNSFCLVRHDYKSPANIEVTPNAHNELTFYSLYMHLLPYQRYLPEYDEVPPPRVKMVASGFMARTGIRDAINCEEYGAISAGAEIDILEEHPDRVHARGRLVKGVVTGRTENQEFWFAYKKDGNAYPRPHGEPSWKKVIPSERTRPGYWAGKVRAVVTGTGLTLREPPATLAHGAQAGMPIKAISRGISENLVLCTTSTIEFDSGKILNLRLGNKTLRMAECTFVPSTSGVATGLKAHSLPVPSSFWACVEDISPNRYVQWHGLIPSVFDEVVFTQTAIKAGDPMGYLGLMENLTGEDGGVSSKYQVHVEVFTDEAGVKDFLKNAAGLKVGKQYLHLAVGTVIKSKAPATNLIRLNKAHSVDLSRATVVKEGNEDWYDVSVVEDGQTVAGLVRKAGADIITQHDWEKLGFQIVEENNTTADGFLNPDDMSQFFKDLFTKIDKNHDGDIDSGELAEALTNADTRDQWAKLIACHPTEWKDKADTAKWNRLNTLLESSPKTLVHEKERIDKFVFWDELLEKSVVRSSFIWHFHPICLIDQISPAGAELITCDQMKRMFPESADDKREEVRVLFNRYAGRFAINTTPRIAQFFAQVKTEVGNALVGKEEDLWYSVEALRSKFRRYFNTYPAEADLYGYKRIDLAHYNALSLVEKREYVVRSGKAYSQLPNENEIAKRIYCCCSPQGGFVLTAGGCIEGVKYKGKGFIQLTWKSNYMAVEKLLKEKLPEEDIDMVGNPDQLLETKIGLLSAMGFWKLNKINNLVDPSTDATDKITEIVNKHTGSYGERRNNFTAIYEAIGG